MPTRELRARAHRRVIRRRRQAVGIGLLLSLVTLLALAGSRLSDALADDAVVVVTAASPTPITKRTPHASVTRTPTTSRSASPSATPSARPTPARATGEYVRAQGSTARHGAGTLRRYRVEVETGIEQGAQTFAAAVDTTLADPSSWISGGSWSLQRIGTDDADFVIRLATPATVDKVCATVGLDTRGYVSCRAGRFVMINHDRWVKAVPDYHGNVTLYRQYVINHEVGHQLGYTHQACPGRGRLAPVMQQQTFGLDGCRANGSPYVDGVLVSGPGAP